MTMTSTEIVDRLRAAVGDRGLVAADDTDRFTTDFKQVFTGSALAVVRPDSTDEVAAVVAICADAGVSVVTQGGNTGLCGGSVPVDGADRPSVVLSMSRMNRILSIEPDRATATVEAGVTIQQLQEAAAEHDLLFAPDWGARGTAQVGGGLATNAGGINVLRWGTMRAQLLGLEVVLPDGRIWDGRRALRKDATGIDIKHLFVGAEGTLGVITGAVFHLHPLPRQHCSAFVALSDLDSLMPLLTLAKDRAGQTLSAFEMIPEVGLGWVVDDIDSARRPLPAGADWYALIRLSGGEQVTDAMAELLSEGAEAGILTDAAVAQSAEQEANLWFIRDELATTSRFVDLTRGSETGSMVHKFDMAIPVDQVVPFLRESEEMLEELVPGTVVYAFGHVGDGNLHYSFFPGPDADRERFAARHLELRDAIDALTWRYGGTISAEHGVGQEMRERLAGQKSAVEFDLMARIKDAIDPDGLMNPGKVLPNRERFDLSTARS